MIKEKESIENEGDRLLSSILMEYDTDSLSCISDEDILSYITTHQDEYFTKMLFGKRKTDILLKLVKDRAMADGKDVSVHINNSDIEFLQQINSKIDNNNNNITLLFFLLIIWRKIHPHDSEWIGFSFNEILSLYFTDREMSSNDAIINVNDISELIPFGLQFQVVGSKTSIPCFKLPDTLLLNNNNDKDDDDCDIVIIYNVDKIAISRYNVKRAYRKLLRKIEANAYE